VNTIWILSVLIFGICTMLERYFSMVRGQIDQNNKLADELSLYSEVLENNLIHKRKVVDKESDVVDKQIRKLEKEIVRRDLELEVLKEKKTFRDQSRPFDKKEEVFEVKKWYETEQPKKDRPKKVRPKNKQHSTHARTPDDFNLLDLL